MTEKEALFARNYLLLSSKYTTTQLLAASIGGNQSNAELSGWGSLIGSCQRRLPQIVERKVAHASVLYCGIWAMQSAPNRGPGGYHMGYIHICEIHICGI